MVSSSDFEKARAVAVDTSDHIATGLLYQNQNEPNFYEQLKPRQGLKTTAVEEVEKINVTEWMKEFV